MELNEIFRLLWKDYGNQSPSALRIHQLFKSHGEEVVNDHIAFRTFDDPRINIDVLAKPFVNQGYKAAGEYRFDEKHLFARHYELPGENAPRVFISQLLTKEFDEPLPGTVQEIIDNIPPEMYGSENLLFSGQVFGKPVFEIYEALRKESEYAAWLYVFGYRANHFTVSVNSLKKFKSIEEVNEFLKHNGFALNSSGGEIKGSREKMLLQSSTLADRVTVEFTDGVHEIPACYYEFAERFKDKNGQLFSGFVAGSADKIFESTDFRDK
jgi:hypothetical protein